MPADRRHLPFLCLLKFGLLKFCYVASDLQRAAGAGNMGESGGGGGGFERQSSPQKENVSEHASHLHQLF